MRHASLRALVLLVPLLLAGCTLPWQSSEADEDVGGNYESGIGAALAVTNDANHTVNVTLRLLREGEEVGRDTLALEPGKTMVRRYALGEHSNVRAQLIYAYDSDGRAASGDDTRDVDTVACAELTRIGWRIVGFQDGIGSQYQGSSCEAP